MSLSGEGRRVNALNAFNAFGVMKVVALDPGKTTGYAQGLIEDGRMVVVTGQYQFGPATLYDHLRSANPDVVVCERFEFRQKARKGLDLIPRELIGVTKLFCEQQENVSLVMQMPAQVMGYFTDKKLKQDNLYKMSKPHANDAARHILYWFVFGPGYKYNKGGYSAGA